MPTLRSGSTTSSPTEMFSSSEARYNAAEETITMRIPELAAIVSQSSRQPRAIKAPRYSEQRDLSEYLADFARVADKNDWDDHEAGIELQNCLEGDALSCALTAETSSCRTIMTALRERLIPTPQQARKALQTLKMTREDVDKLAAQCRRYTELGYGAEGLNVSEGIMEQQKVEAFIEGLRHRDLVHAVGIQKPETLQEAVKLAKEFLRRDQQFTRKVRCFNCSEDTSPERGQLPHRANQLAICSALTSTQKASGNE